MAHHGLWCVLIFALWLLGACATSTSERKPLPTSSPQDESVVQSGKHSASAVRSLQLFKHFSDAVAGERFVKFVVDVKSDTIAYFNVREYPMHTDYIFAEVYKEEISPERLGEFMSNYNEEKPEFILGYLVYHVDQNIWTFSFWEGDRMSPKHVDKAYSHLTKSFFAADRISFRPDSMHHEDVAKELDDVPVITNDAIYKMATYQGFNVGESVGLLRIVTDEDLKDLSYNPNEIVILKAIVPNITVVAGIISEQFSTPLSHVALRARAWNVPHLGLKNASIKFAKLAGKMVFLAATESEYVLRLATDVEIAQFRAKRAVKREVVIPKANLTELRLKGLDAIRATEVQAYGAKTSNLGEIVHGNRPGINVPTGFGVPIAYYDQHMKTHGLYERAHGLLANKEFQEDARARRDKLKHLRQMIRDAPLSPEVLDKLWAKSKAIMDAGASGVFVRSSTNAEDLPGFNGAGLYDTIPNVKSRAELEKAVKKVWASVWNLRAVEERSFHGIDHRGVYGAVLIQAGVNATAAGVLVTTNLFDTKSTHIYTINAKWGLGMKVVDGRETPEQLLVDIDTGQVRVVSRSEDETMLVFDDKGGVKEVTTADKGRAVLTNSRTMKLANAAKELVSIFGVRPPLDIEWLFVGEELQIVQSRPFVTK
jgi:hypothetical protein